MAHVATHDIVWVLFLLVGAVDGLVGLLLLAPLLAAVLVGRRTHHCHLYSEGLHRLQLAVRDELELLQLHCLRLRVQDFYL